MALNYAKGKAVGNNQVPFYDSPPPFVALASSGRDNGSASSILTLTDDTTAVEVVASSGVTYVKWLTQAVVDSSVAGTSVIGVGASANFDHVVPANTARRFVVPIAQQNNSQGYSSMVGANVANGLYKNVAIMTGAIASVAAAEY